MSHNKITVGGQAPNVNSEITVNVNNLNDVNISSLADNQVLQYDNSASQWKNETLSASVKYIQIGAGESDDYTNSGLASIGANDQFRIYDTSPENTISGASITNVSGTSWVEYITLPAGKYQVISQVRVAFSASGYFAFRIVSDPTGTPATLTPYSVIGDNAGSYAQGVSQTLQGYISLGSTTQIGFRIVAVQNVSAVASQGNTPSEFSYLFIEQLES